VCAGLISGLEYSRHVPAVCDHPEQPPAHHGAASVFLLEGSMLRLADSLLGYISDVRSRRRLGLCANPDENGHQSCSFSATLTIRQIPDLDRRRTKDGYLAGTRQSVGLHTWRKIGRGKQQRPEAKTSSRRPHHVPIATALKCHEQCRRLSDVFQDPLYFDKAATAPVGR
jgi:hypothetical protein